MPCRFNHVTLCLRTFPVKCLLNLADRLQFIRMHGRTWRYHSTQNVKISDLRSCIYIHLIHLSITLLAFLLNIKRKLFFCFFLKMIFKFSLALTHATSLRLSAFEFISLYHQILLDLKTVSRRKIFSNIFFRLQISLTLMISCLVLFM